MASRWALAGKLFRGGRVLKNGTSAELFLTAQCEFPLPSRCHAIARLRGLSDLAL
jgi:hypothetical protein